MRKELKGGCGSRGEDDMVGVLRVVEKCVKGVTRCKKRGMRESVRWRKEFGARNREGESACGPIGVNGIGGEAAARIADGIGVHVSGCAQFWLYVTRRIELF